ncbi:MAG: glycosyltransferase family 4 protein [Nitrospirae bacterium]|nr:glycosyltransferase family 4 protein [Magnetococcales bacterium]
MMTDLKQLHLVLFFTEGVSLEIWDRGGLFDREVALYKALLPHLKAITFVTYGRAYDLDFAQRIAGIRIVCNRWNLGPQWYRRTFPLALRSCRKGPAIFKSNQVRGGGIPVYLARRFGKPSIARCGYLPSHGLRICEGEHAERTRQAMAWEHALFSQADRCVVTTQAMKECLRHEYGIEPERVRIIPNYVDTTLFAPDTTREKNKRRIIFIGRLEKEKNIFPLIDALVAQDVELWIVGDGSQRQALENVAREKGVSTRFFGTRPHHELPELLNRSAAFILPSIYEGHPKTLLEALSCGLPCIGSDIPSIRSVIRHGENGLLCGLDAASIRHTVVPLLEQPALQERLGQNARAYARQHLSLERIVEMELEVYRELLHRTCG